MTSATEHISTAHRAYKTLDGAKPGASTHAKQAADSCAAASADGEC